MDVMTYEELQASVLNEDKAASAAARREKVAARAAEIREKIANQTAEEREKFLTDRKELREIIKRESALQAKEKKLLRQPHDKMPQMTFTGYKGSEFSLCGKKCAAQLMMRCFSRALDISNALVSYKKLLGKPFDMHEKRGEK